MSSNQVSFAVAHRRYVASLYKRALKTSLDWYVFRDIWRPKALEIRARFEANKDVKSFKHLKSILQATEEELWNFRHPDPYIYPTAPGGSKFERNIPPPILHKQPEH